MSREALELAKFIKFDTLGEIVCLNNSAWGLKDAISTETRLTLNLHVVEHMLQKIVPAAGRNSKGPAELIEVLRDLAAKLKAAAPCLNREVKAIVGMFTMLFKILKRWTTWM